MTRPGAPGTAADRFRVDPPTVPAPREHADPAEPGRRIAGRHRAPPPVPTPRAPTVIAVAAAVLTAASLTAIAGQAVAPDGRVAASQVSTVTRAERTTAGPLEIPTIGASGAWSPPEDTEPAQRPVTVTGTPVRAQTPASTVRAVLETLVPLQTASQPTVTPEPQPVTNPEPDTASEDAPAEAPSSDPAAADSPSSATPTEESPMPTPTETTVTVDVTP